MKLTTLAIAAVLVAASLAATKEELKARFAQRYPELRAQKDRGAVGETYKGLVEAVKSGDSAADKLVAEENADREELFKVIASAEGTTPDVVANRLAARNFANAKAGDYLKGPDGTWKKK
jgi:uncharacterized protein YdbL (DUF1318 family)